MHLQNHSAKVNLPQLVDAVTRNDNHAFCLACGEHVTHIDEETNELVCDSCGGRAVYEAEELFMVLL